MAGYQHYGRAPAIPNDCSSVSYIWNRKDKLGHGATGEVFIGYGKKNGQKVAVKMFTKMNEYRAMQNEIGTIKQLRYHKNLVQFLEIEEMEKQSQTPIIVMELCNGGSLYEVIDSPVNAMGLEEQEFKLVMSDVAQGLAHLRKHGFVHRDIKPGNIMRTIEPDGKLIFKLADFGTARKLGPNERFTSLHGTEEYLYPAMYERALIDPRSQEEFRDKVDLWSVGATFFHLATGRLPFQPFEKRRDRATMLKITTEKSKGVILGWQTEHGGKIFYSKDLPPDIRLSVGLRNVLTPILAGLLDNFENMLEFHKFFESVERIAQMKVVDVFCVSRCTSHKIYLDVHYTDVIPVLKEQISVQTLLNPKHMEFYFENLPFTPKGPIRTMDLPDTTPESPLMVFGGPPQKADKLETPVLARPPVMSPNIEIIDDLKYVKDATKIAWSCLRSAEIVERYFKLMHQGALTLRETINKEYLFWSSSFEETNSLYVSLIDLYESEVSSLKIEISLLQMINATYNDALVDEIKHLSADVRSKENELQQIKDEQIGLYHQSEDFKPRIIEVLNYSQWNTNFCNELFNGSMKTMQTYVDTIEGLFKEFQEQKKTKTPDTTYEKRVYEFNKRAVQERLANAEEKLRLMIEGRSKVYVKLYEFLRKCIPVREHLVDFNKSLEHCSAKIRQNMTRMKQWMPSHHQRMQDIMGKLNTMGMGSKRMGGAATPSAIDPSMIGNLMSIISSLQANMKENLKALEQQSEKLKKI